MIEDKFPRIQQRPEDVFESLLRVRRLRDEGHQVGRLVRGWLARKTTHVERFYYLGRSLTRVEQLLNQATASFIVGRVAVQ